MWNPLKDWVGWLLIASLVVGIGWGYFHPRENWREAAMRDYLREFADQRNVRMPFYWKRLAPYIGQINIDTPDALLREFEKIPPAAGHLLAAYWCQAAVLNGSFDQFFASPTGILAPEAVEGFRAIGLTDAADVLEQAMQLLPQPYPRDTAVRSRALSRKLRQPDSREALEELETRFIGLLSSSQSSHADLFETAADRYARENLGDD